MNKKGDEIDCFDKVCTMLNMVLHVRRTDWDLHVPVVLWAYRTMCKTLTTRELLKPKYEAAAIIPMERAKPSPHIVDTTVYKAQNEGITQP